MRIFLTGFMASGKSSLAKELAEALDLPLVDLDEKVSEKMQMPVAQIFDEFGENAFRDMEKNAFHETLNTHSKFVMATGGGTPCHNDLMKVMNREGLTIYLKLLSHEVLKRLKKEKDDRPLLKGLSGNDLKIHVEQLLKERAPYYAQAQIIVHPGEMPFKRLVKEIQDHQ